MHVCRLASQMHRDNSFCAGSDCLLNQAYVNVVSIGLTIHKCRSSTESADGQWRSNKSISGQDYLVPRTNVQRHQSQAQSIQTAADTDSMFGPNKARKSLLKLLNLCTENKITLR